MKYTNLLLAVILLISCKKDTSTATPKPADGTGTYNGIIDIKINKTPSIGSPSTLKPITENSTQVMTVDITLANGVYSVNGNPMTGGPTTYQCSNSNGIYLFNLSQLTIDYSYSNNRQEFVKVGAGSFKYDVNESRTGTLK